MHYKNILDASCLFKLYHSENETQIVLDAISTYKTNAIFLSELAKIEFVSTMWKKVPTLEFTEPQRSSINARFESGFAKYSFVDLNKDILAKQNFLLKNMENKV